MEDYMSYEREVFLKDHTRLAIWKSLALSLTTNKLCPRLVIWELMEMKFWPSLLGYGLLTIA